MKKTQAGGGVAVKIEHAVYQSAKMFGRHFDEKDELYSRISRQSIDVLKVCTSLVHTSALLTWCIEHLQDRRFNGRMAIDQSIEIGKVTSDIFYHFTLTITRSVSISNEEVCLRHLFLHIIIASIKSSHIILRKCHITADGELLFS